jgi:hypothetical protein
MIACIVALAVSAIGAGPHPPSTPSLSAGTIFAKARVAMYLRQYPRYVAYIIDIQATAYGKHYHEGYRAYLRTHDNALVVKSTPVYTTNQPVNPYGFSFFGIDKEGKPSDHIEPPFGVPWMSAVYDFDLARPPAPKSGETPAPEVDEARVLGHVEVSGGDYDVSLLGRETDDGVDVYHLALQPLRDPDRNRIRELWVDAKTFDVRKLITYGIFSKGPPSSVPWTVTFIQLQGHWFIRQETTSATLSTPGHLFGGSTQYQGINYTFGLYEYPGLISDLEFIPFGVATDAVQQ